LAHQQYPKMKIGVFTDWLDYVRLFEPNVTTKTYASGVPEFDAFDHALEYLASDKPEFLFIHIDFVDHAGHSKGWGGPEYLAAVQQADQLLGRLLDTLDRINLRKATTILVVSDHGGRTTHHGGDSMAEIEVPWIISGPGIRANYQIQARNLLQYDTAATIARVLKVEPSPCWRAVPIEEAFAKK
jgi:predicted AlkP superfamily pyrophosphatase or phosphodiesterase